MIPATKLKNLNIRFSPRHLYFHPEWLVLGVNNACNLHCKMCDVGTGYTESNFARNLTGATPLNMPPELIRNIIDQAALYFPKVKLGYAFTEPLVYPHLADSLQYAKSKGIYTAMTTNALTLPQKAEALCKGGLNDIFISLDGPEEIHNFIRGNKNSFRKAVEGIEKLLSFNERPGISVFCAITEWNIGHLNAFADYFRSFPLKQLGFMHTNFTPDWLAVEHNQHYGHVYPATLSNTTEINPEGMDLKLLFEETEALRKKKYSFPLTFSPSLDTMEAVEAFYLQPGKRIGKRCNDAFRNIMIKSDGTVIPSHGRCYNLQIGNLYEQDLKSIWNSKVIGDFRKALIEADGLLPACARCCSAF